MVVVLLLITKVGPQKGLAAAGRKLGALVEGVRFLGQTQVMLAAITLDLFAVLLGGATTLLPIYAKSILHVGPMGLGWLQAADSLGADPYSATYAAGVSYVRERLDAQVGEGALQLEIP